MTRRVDGTKKPALLSAIVDYLVEAPLAGLTFRGIASALGVSTYTFVYHFGDKAQLIAEIAAYVVQRSTGFTSDASADSFSLETYAQDLRRNFALTLLPRNIALQRIEFQAQLTPTLLAPNSATRRDDLTQRTCAALFRLGLTQGDAAAESEELLDSFYGIQLTLVTTNDTDRARHAFEQAATHHLERVGIRLRTSNDQTSAEPVQ